MLSIPHHLLSRFSFLVVKRATKNIGHSMDSRGCCDAKFFWSPMDVTFDRQPPARSSPLILFIFVLSNSIFCCCTSGVQHKWLSVRCNKSFFFLRRLDAMPISLRSGISLSSLVIFELYTNDELLAGYTYTFFALVPLVILPTFSLLLFPNQVRTP